MLRFQKMLKTKLQVSTLEDEARPALGGKDTHHTHQCFSEEDKAWEFDVYKYDDAKKLTYQLAIPFF